MTAAHTPKFDVAGQVPAPRPRRAASRHDLAFARDVIAGLAAPQKSIPGHWRLDARGTALLSALTTADANHPASLEAALMTSAAAEIAALAGSGARLLAWGERCAAGMAILREAIDRLGRTTRARSRRRLLYVPGAVSATLPCDATTAHLLRDAAQRGGYDILVVAADAVRDPATLVAGDAENTALATAFDLNLLVRIDRELGADFDPLAFERQLRFDPRRQCVETHLGSRLAQRIRVLGRDVEFAAGESILVDRAYRHCLPRFEGLARAAGWSHAQLWVDAAARFALHVLERD